MKAKTIGGVKFRLSKIGGLHLEIIDTSRDSAGTLLPAPPRGGGLSLYHVQALQDWLRELERELEDGRYGA